MSEKVLLNVKKIIRKWPAYRRFLESKGVDTLKIKSMQDLPILDKKFIEQAIHTVPLCKVRNVVPSSGSTGPDFSFGLFGDDEMRKASAAIDEFLQSRFETKRKKTLVLNVLPGAISLQSSTVTVASIGVRMDTAVYAIKSLGSSFEQIILVGEPLFIKNLIEYGLSESIPWRYLPLFIIVGGEWIPENYRGYLERIVGSNRVLSSMGMAELGLNYFHETGETIALTHLLLRDKGLLSALFGDWGFCPALFVYNEDDLYIETLDGPSDLTGSILLTTIDPCRVLPLIRYRSGDKGKRLSRVEINDVLNSMGYAGLINAAGPPILAHFGRGLNVARIYPEEIKEIIYSSDEIASRTTGNFLLSAVNNSTKLDIQLKEDILPNPEIENMLDSAFQGLPLYVKAHVFEVYPYPLNFERKVRYVREGDSCSQRRGKEVELLLEV